MSNPVSVVGGMGATMDGTALGGADMNGAIPASQAQLEIGVVDNKIGFKIAPPGSQPLVMLFTSEIYNIMGALESAAAHVRNDMSTQFSTQISQLQAILSRWPVTNPIIFKVLL